jgi:predicted short-subunit dehydrogenase-like oxidoreductase (DUF2520 family)
MWHFTWQKLLKKVDSYSQIFGRNATELSKISEELHIPFSTETLADADLYLISVSDSSIAEVSTLIKKKNVLVAHTSGSVSREALVGNYRKSVFYPLQTFSKSKKLDTKKFLFSLMLKTKKMQKF